MVDVETSQRGGGPRWENGNVIMDEEDNVESEDLESNSAKLFERSRIKALAGLHLLSMCYLVNQNACCGIKYGYF
jgi:hypothetical protein